jgi:succinoglycan biosynthesis protein ExoH
MQRCLGCRQPWWSGMDKEISRRISVARYLMIIGVVILHIPPYKPLSEYGTTAFEVLRGTLTYGFFRATVPVLTAISGYFVFSSVLDRDVPKLLSKKTATLLLPLLLSNLPLLLVLFAMQRYGLATHQFSVTAYPFNWNNWLNAGMGLFGLPLNYPTHFLRDLFALSLLAPLMGILLRKTPYLGLLLVLAVYWFNLDASLVLRNSMLVTFYLGGLAAVRKWDLRRLDPFAPGLLAAFATMAVAIVVFHIHNREWFSLVSPFLVWPSMALIVDSRIGRLLLRYSKASFFTFLAHGPLLIAAWILFSKYCAGLPYVVFWLVTPLIVVPLCVLGHVVLLNLLPRLSVVLLGRRIAKPEGQMPALSGTADDSISLEQRTTDTEKSHSG